MAETAVPTAGILIVEDETIVSMTLARLLTSRGYHVLGEAQSGEEAVNLAQKTAPDLILMDIRLGGQIDGIEAARQIQQHRDIPLIYLTANTDKETVERAKYTQPHGYIVKPFEPENIFLTVEMALYKHHMERKLKASEARNRKILDLLPDYIFILDGNNHLKDFRLPADRPPNPSLEQLRGQHIAQIYPDFHWLKPQALNQVIEAVQQAKATGKAQNLELEYHDARREPQQRYLDLRITSISQEETLLLARDVTEERRAKKQMLDIVLQTQERERQRFATDLHDSLGQLLSAIKLNVETLAPGLSPDNIPTWETVRTMLDEAVRETRQISHALMSDTLRELGLFQAIRELCKRSSRPQLRINCQMIGDQDRPDRRTEIGLYRVVQELLNNAIRHAKATEIDLQIVRHDDSLVITLEDNGQGFDPTTPVLKGGIGLKSVRNRISMLNGNINIESQPHNGTAISIEVPA